MSIFALHLKLAIGRVRLGEMADELGLNHPKVIRYSQRLDKLHNKLQRAVGA